LPLKIRGLAMKFFGLNNLFIAIFIFAFSSAAISIIHDKYYLFIPYFIILIFFKFQFYQHNEGFSKIDYSHKNKINIISISIFIISLIFSYIMYEMAISSILFGAVFGSTFYVFSLIFLAWRSIHR